MAINRVVEKAKIENKKPLKDRKYYLLILLDIKNAFNSISWKAIKQSLGFYNTPIYLQKIIDDYLTERTIISSKTRLEMTAGVPQGSVLGPTLWNIAYNEVFSLDLPEGADLTGYADDLALTIGAQTVTLLEHRANAALRTINTWLKKQSLELAAQKSESVLITNRYKIGNFKIELEGEQIEIKDAVKYLGVTIDKRLSFTRHIRAATEKASKISNNLNRIMPRTYGAGEGKRKLLAKIAESIISYGAPVWGESLKIKQNTKNLGKAQRATAIRVSRAYRTVSSEVLMVIGRCIPWDIKSELRQKLRNGEEQCEDFESRCLEIWQHKWSSNNTNKGKWTRSLIPDIRRWYNRPHGELTFELTQALTGHGCFQSYLFRIGKKLSPTCVHCNEGVEDEARHTIFVCRKFIQERRKLVESINGDFSTENMITKMLENKENWDKISTFIAQLMRIKAEYDGNLQRGEPATNGQRDTDVRDRQQRRRAEREEQYFMDRAREEPSVDVGRHLPGREETNN